jgi:REP element-mobilizing transposase RayT
MSELYQSLTHSRWNCKYHVVFVPNDLATLCFTSLKLWKYGTLKIKSPVRGRCVR